MPCSDSSSRVVVRIGRDDRLAGFDYKKITCGKEIGGDQRLLARCAGMGLDALLSLTFRDLLDAVGSTDEESDFLLFLEWDALTSSLRQYAGLDPGSDPSRYQIASIEYGDEGALIRQVIRPPADMPKIRSCASVAGLEVRDASPAAARRSCAHKKPGSP